MGASPLAGLCEGIRFVNVSFAYPGGGGTTLHALNLHIRCGEKIALVGENGAGKATLAKLLLGLYRPTVGAIRIDGVDLEQLGHTIWRRQVGAVFQDYMGYAFSARENIGFGWGNGRSWPSPVRICDRRWCSSSTSQLPHSTPRARSMCIVISATWRLANLCCSSRTDWVRRVSPIAFSSSPKAASSSRAHMRRCCRRGDDMRRCFRCRPSGIGNKAGEWLKCIRYSGYWDPTKVPRPRGPTSAGLSTPRSSS